MVFDSFFNSIFGGIIGMNPLGAILLISFILTLVITLLYKVFTDQKALKAIKDEMKEMREEMKNFKNDPQKMIELQKKSMQKSLEQMKHTIKPMLITMIPLIIIFGWLRTAYTEIGVLIFGLSWLWIYILSSIIFSIILRKVLKVH